jgi:putative hydrolase of the HAD superfamily
MKESYRKESFARALSELGIEDRGLAVELGSTFARNRRSISDVYPDVKPALTELAKDYRLGLLTNGAPDLQNTKLDASGLGSYFESITISGEFGYGKPSPEIFARALEGLNAKAETTIMSGDSLTRDVAGAQAVGMRGVWMNREDRTNESDVIPDATVTSMDELVVYLESE